MAKEILNTLVDMKYLGSNNLLFILRELSFVPMFCE